MRTLTDEEWGVITNALRVAAEKFSEYAHEPALVTELQQQFGRQADQCRKLYSEIADSTGMAN